MKTAGDLARRLLQNEEFYKSFKELIENDKKLTEDLTAPKNLYFIAYKKDLNLIKKYGIIPGKTKSISNSYYFINLYDDVGIKSLGNNITDDLCLIKINYAKLDNRKLGNNGNYIYSGKILPECIIC